MARREWTFWIRSEDTTRLRPYRVPRELIRLAIAGGLLAVAVLGSAATRLFHAAESSLEERRLVQRSALLEAELGSLRARISTLGATLYSLLGTGEALPAAAVAAPAVSVASADEGGPETVSPFYGSGAGVPTADGSAEMDVLLRRARVLAFGWREAGDALKQKADELASTPSILPTSGYITSVFSWSRWHPLLGRPRPHLGVDIVAPPGTPVVSAARGRVSFVGWRGEYGLLVEVDHDRGRVTRYAHLSRATVRYGQRVDRGDIIGRVGATGLAAGPHLHYEVLINGRPANPRRYILQTRATPD